MTRTLKTRVCVFRVSWRLPELRHVHRAASWSRLWRLHHWTVLHLHGKLPGWVSVCVCKRESVCVCMFVRGDQLLEVFIVSSFSGSFLTPPKSYISARSQLIEPFYNKWAKHTPTHAHTYLHIHTHTHTPTPTHTGLNRSRMSSCVF